MAIHGPKRPRNSAIDAMIARTFISLIVALLACNTCEDRLAEANVPEGSKVIPPSCARGNPQDLMERPLLILKYSRTGSTWLAWTGQTMELASGKEMNWVHEAQGCGGRVDAEELTTWFEEYYGRETDGKVVTQDNFNKNNDGPHALPSKCLETVKAENVDDIGVLVATLNPHASHNETPPLSDNQWVSSWMKSKSWLDQCALHTVCT